MEERAQGAIEYLLVIGAAVLVVAVVIIALSEVLVETQKDMDNNDYNNSLNKLQNIKK